MDKKKLFRFLSIILICLLFVLLTVALLGQQFYGEYQAREPQVEILGKDIVSVNKVHKTAECLVLTNSAEVNSSHARTEIEGIFEQLKVNADYTDLSKEELPDYGNYEKIVLAVEDYDRMGEDASLLLDWVKEGGNVMVFFPPQAGSVFRAVSSSFGIQEFGWEMYELPGIRMKTPLLLGGEGRDFMIEEPYESSLTLSLYDDCIVHIVSADDRELPVLWERKFGKGTIVFDNFGIMEKAYRGIHAAGYSLLGEAFAWPVINGSAFYLDDFPSPVPSGASEYIQRDYGVSVKDFYTNVWWPDLLELSEKYGCRYSGMVIEDYSDQVEAPFEPNQNTQRFRYFGSSLLKNGGEIGLHGYNHIPLCLKGFDSDFGDGYKQGTYERLFDYGYWNSGEDMAASLRELIRFTKGLFPQTAVSVYVPPSNILSADARKMLVEQFPEIRAVASIYFQGDVEYTQEFEVAEDGLIETPRIISGYIIDPFMEIAALSELNLHYVNSHFQHPDDVLDPDRGAESGWETMRGRLEEYLTWLKAAAPDIRNLTAGEMAGAVQRYFYLDAAQEITEDEIRLTLSNFKDEAYLLIRINGRTPENLSNCISGGELTDMGGGLFLIRAYDSEIVIRRGGM